MSPDWFRNTAWDASVEQAFNEKLRRARKKDQYLRIQACTLATSHPEAALQLLDRYFALPDAFDQAQAHVDRATALLALDRVEEAVAAYEAALARETAFPHVQTRAYLYLPYLIATRGMQHLYARAIELLKQHESRLTFPVDYFCWFAAIALIADAVQVPETARAYAREALRVARERRAAPGGSMVGGRPAVGLVTSEHDQVIARMKTLCRD